LEAYGLKVGDRFRIREGLQIGIAKVDRALKSAKNITLVGFSSVGDVYLSLDDLGIFGFNRNRFTDKEFEKVEEPEQKPEKEKEYARISGQTFKINAEIRESYEYKVGDKLEFIKDFDPGTVQNGVNGAFKNARNIEIFGFQNKDVFALQLDDKLFDIVYIDAIRNNFRKITLQSETKQESEPKPERQKEFKRLDSGTFRVGDRLEAGRYKVGDELQFIKEFTNLETVNEALAKAKKIKIVGFNSGDLVAMDLDDKGVYVFYSTDIDRNFKKISSQ